MANPIDIYGYIMIHYIVSYTYNEHYHVLMHTYMIYVAKKKKHFIFSWGINKQLKKGGATQHTHAHIYIYILYIYIYVYCLYIYICIQYNIIYDPFILSIKVSTDLISLIVRAAVRCSLQHS